MDKQPDTTVHDTVVFYGSLMSAFPTLKQLGLHNKLLYQCKCELEGNLYNLGDYPGLKVKANKKQRVSAELYRFSDQQVLHLLDDYEDYDPNNLQASLFRRELIDIAHPVVKAWVYIYNQPVLESDLVQSGDWQQYLATADKE